MLKWVLLLGAGGLIVVVLVAQKFLASQLTPFG